MAKYLLTIFTLLWAFTATGQELKLVTGKFKRTKQIAESYYVLKSDKKIKHGPYVSYFSVPEYKYKYLKKGPSDNFDNYIRQKGNYNHGQKDGEWIEFAAPNKLKAKGSYQNGKKTGVWVTPKEEGVRYFVLERFDHDANKKIKPFISVQPIYPKSAMEASLQGSVILSFQTHRDCSISNIRVIKSLSEDCDSSAIEALKKYGELYKKHGFDCVEDSVTQAYDFRIL